MLICAILLLFTAIFFDSDVLSMPLTCADFVFICALILSMLWRALFTSLSYCFSVFLSGDPYFAHFPFQPPVFPEGRYDMHVAFVFLVYSFLAFFLELIKYCRDEICEK